MMWPPVLDMTRDECRGVLRRLELETYSNVVSTFRAQGGLSDVKIKLLEELRNVFHISTDRHRAEARRVANDEQLCTIAETISGPNTTQEWSREGRRPFPLLPRVPPFTAFSAVANGVAEMAKHENAILPYPSETSTTRKARGADTEQDTKQIVKQDPALLSVDEKRNLKRQAQQLADTANPTSPTNKKRTISGSGGSENAQQSHFQLHTNTKIQQLYHNHSKTQSRHKKSNIAKRGMSGNMKVMAKSSAALNTNQAKVQGIPKTQKLSDSLGVPLNKNNLPTPRNLHTYASMPQQSVQYENYLGNEKSGKLIVEPPEGATNNWPQIATSKKDITNNLSKLNMMSNSQLHSSPSSIVGDGGRIEASIPTNIFNSEGRPLLNNVMIANPTSWVPKTQAASTPIGHRPGKTSNPNSCSSKITTNTKQLQQTQHQPSPNSSAIPLPGGYININQKAVKPENATVVNLNERKEIEMTNASVVATTAFTRQDSISDVDGSANKPTIIGSGNFDLKTNSESTPSNLSGSLTCGTKPKIQIHSNQTISPGYGSIKFTTGMQLKGITGRKAVQIVSSPSGKVFIQPADSSKSQSGITPGSSNLTTTQNRYALQKVQIVPSSSTAPMKPISLNKSDMILMPGSVLSPTTNSGNIVVRNIPMMKQSKRLPTAIINKPILNELSSTSSSFVKNQNVIVIGAIPTEKNIKDASNKNLLEANMITEDTPVDILTTPVSNIENTIQMTTPTLSKETSAKYEIKSPITVLQTVTSPNEDINKRVLAKEDQAGYLAENHKPQQQSISNAEIMTTIRDNVEVMDSENNYIVSSTDWEVELDQQAANKNRRNQTAAAREVRLQQIQSDDVSSALVTAEDEESKDGNEASQQIIDNFHDVIEEDTIYEESIINETTEGEDDVDFDVSYGSAQEEIEDNVAIEYVEDGGTSSDILIEEYGEAGKFDTEENNRSHVKTLPVSQAQTIIYSTNNSDSNSRGKVFQSSESSSSVIYEIDDGFNQINR
ncbi:BRCA2-interacting transcriptional repressor EMSY isoform X2 [Hermetia illucens]|nr:BRCA2-interacting transcriptional repressor EMSY isoform X2 [Hermetia illucens]